MKHEYPKMVYKDEKKPVVQHKDEVGYHWQIVKSEEEHEALGSEWGEHPEHKKSVSEKPVEKSEKPLDLKISKKSKSE